MRPLIRKTILISFALILLSAAIFGCAASDEFIPSDKRITEFTSALSRLDFDSAYDYLWKYAGTGRKTFIEDCEKLVDAIGITGISIENARAEKDTNGQYTLRYTSVLTFGKEKNVISTDCETVIVNYENDTYFKYTHSLLLADYEKNDRIITVSVPGKRGEIFTSDGEIAAENNYSDTVYIVPSEIDGWDRLATLLTYSGNTVSVCDYGEFESILSNIGSIVELSDKDIKNAKRNFDTAAHSEYGTSIIAAYPHNSISEETEEKLSQIQGVYVDRERLTEQRYYPQKNVYSHIVGYANNPSAEAQLDTIKEGGYSLSSVYGKEGIEKTFNEKLLAKDGFRIAVTDENFQLKSVLFEKPAQNGTDIILSIDDDLQKTAYNSLLENMDTDQTGAAIVIDYTTGAAKAMVSIPSFDANIFSFPISAEEYELLFEAEGTDQPLFARATLGLYPPGSTIKPFIAGAALDKGIVTEYTEFPYTIVNNKWTPPGWKDKVVTRNEDSGAPLVMKNAIIKSDNIYFSWLGLKMGKDMLFPYLESIGFRKDFLFDLNVATSSIVKENTQILEYIVADTSIGHGEMLISPIQMASLYTAFTNKGSVLKPYVVSELRGTDESGQYGVISKTEKSELVPSIMTQSSLNTVREAMRGVVTSGTARSLNMNDRTVYAKTGTAIKQQGTDKRISWVIAWSEDTDDPKLVLVMIDGPADKDDIKFAVASALIK